MAWCRADRVAGNKTQGAGTPGLLDQSALYGVLGEIEALGLDLLEVRQFMPDRKSPGSDDGCSP